MMQAMDDLISGDSNQENTILLAHGAGAGMEHRFMQYFAEKLSTHHWKVVRFEFPYMQQMRVSGKRRPPNPQKVLIQSWLDKVSQYSGKGKLVIAGKSMGGRMASMIADEVDADGLIVFGYPFHPQKKPQKLRTQHLESLQTSSLFLQGERDSLGNREEVSGYKLSSSITLEWLLDGDHGFKPRSKSATTEIENWQLAVGHCNHFLLSIAD